MHSSPGISSIRSSARSRLLLNSLTIANLSSCGPRIASTAASWTKEVQHEIEWDWSLLIALILSSDATAHPILQPVMA